VKTLRCREILLPILIPLVGLGATAAPQSTNTSPTQHSMGSRQHYVGLPNFGEVTPNLFRGGQPGVDGLEALEKMGVSIVVDMRGSKSSHEEIAVSKLGMQYVAIPWHCPFPADPVFARFLKLIEDNPGKKIFVHCRLGDDRTGMAIAAYRMAEEGWSADEALEEMKRFGFTAAHHAICPTLGFYEKHFPEHLKTNPELKALRPPAAAARQK
jgi:tyrosine-protein phosphatase SIW14